MFVRRLNRELLTSRLVAYTSAWGMHSCSGKLEDALLVAVGLTFIRAWHIEEVRENQNEKVVYWTTC